MAVSPSYNSRKVADIIIKVVPRHLHLGTKVVPTNWLSTTRWNHLEHLLVEYGGVITFISKMVRDRGKGNYEVLEHYLFSTKRHLWTWMRKTDSLERMFSISETVKHKIWLKSENISVPSQHRASCNSQ